MGQTDLAIRFLATNYLGTLLPALLRGCEVEVIAVEQSEVKLVERQADYVARARIDGVETILHVEFQSRHDDNLPARILAYHALLRHQHHPLPVRSLVVYLMHEPPPRAISSSIQPRRGDPQVSFSYDIFCPWEHPITIQEVWKHPALAPLVALTPGIGTENLAALRQTVEERAIEDRSDLLAVLFVLAGRRFPEDVLLLLLRSKAMEESVTYQWILAEGRAEGLAKGRAEGHNEGKAEGLRRAVVEFVQARLATVPDGLDARLAALDPDALDALFSRLVRAADAAELERILAE